jgi:hypothetical protein
MGEQQRQPRVAPATVDRFLSWPLPVSVRADRCATEPGAPHRTGTNLLTAGEAGDMLAHVLAGYVGIDEVLAMLGAGATPQELVDWLVALRDGPP